MLSLSELGIKKNWTYETIITCFNGDMPHAAPFGFKSPDMKTVQLEMYKGSNTLAFIMYKREFINIIISFVGLSPQSKCQMQLGGLVVKSLAC